MKKIASSGLGAIAAVFMTAGAVMAQQPAAKTANASGGDQMFVKEAAMGGMAEVELGRLASQKASSPEVKQFGERMVADHSKANDQLKPIAQQKNIEVPTQLTGKHKAEYDRLSKLSGAQFDRAYTQLMLQDHRKDVSDFRKESTSGKDSDVKNFATQTLPTLEEHLKMVQSMASGARATSGKGDHGATGTSGTGTSGTSGNHGGHDTTDAPTSLPLGSGVPATPDQPNSPGAGR